MNNDQLKKLEADLWRAADSLRANSDLKASEYSTPVLGLIFLKFADNKYRQHEVAILAEYQKLKGSRREKPLSDIAIEHCGFYLPDHARYGYLLTLPEKDDIAKALKKAMEAIKEYKPELAGVLPQDEYFRLTRSAQNTCISFAFGKMGITSRPSLTNQQINSIVVNGNHDFRFVYYLLKAYKPFIFSYNSGIDTPIVPKSVFEGIQVVCPPKSQ